MANTEYATDINSYIKYTIIMMWPNSI